MRRTPVVKAKDVKYVRFAAPDLDLMQTFVEDFGLVVVHRDDDVLYSRGLEGSPFLHVVHRGPATFIGFSFEVDTEDDLEALAAAVPNCSPVHDIGGIEGDLGGGRRVHFVEPITGVVIEAVHGQQAEPLEPQRDRLQYNHGGVYDRLGAVQDVSSNRRPSRADPGPPDIVRLGHCVLAVPPGDHQQMMDFLAETFGMIVSDATEVDTSPDAEPPLHPKLAAAFESCETNVMSQFMRMDRGDDFTDHHTVLVFPLLDRRAIQADGRLEAQLSHCAFEVFSIDDVFRGHMSLRAKADAGRRYAVAWGVGRHVYGSQVYDYWHDPYGHVHEHMVDGDKLTSATEPNVYDFFSLGENGGNQWGPTVAGTGVHNLDGPQRAPHFADLDDVTRASILTRDLTDLEHIIDSL